jgi:hypothetical protein
MTPELAALDAFLSACIDGGMNGDAMKKAMAEYVKPSAPAWHDAPNAPDRCWCQTCRPITLTDYRMVLCPECGNKRCPKATDHRNACTGSNEPGQPGSSYPAITAIELPCWRSAPTSAGVWLNSCDGSCTVVTNNEGEWANAGMAAGRWFGPISPDTEDTK